MNTRSDSNTQSKDGTIGTSKHLVPFAISALNQDPQPVRIALVDDEGSVHELVRRVFTKYAQDWTLDSYLDGRQALKQIPQFPPDAVLMDISMPGITGIECANKLKNLLPNLPVVMLSAHIDPQSLPSFMMTGASGCLFKPASAMDIVVAIKKSMAGTLALCSRAEKIMLEYFFNLGKNYDCWELTNREKEVVNCFCQQKTDKEISKLLNMATNTVHAHTNSIFKKLKVHNRTEAIQKIMSIGQAS